MLERCLSIYTGPDSFPYTNFPVLHFFRHSLLPPKQILTPFALKHCPQRKSFKTLGNTSPSKALLRMLERCLSLYTGPDSFPYTNFPVDNVSYFFSMYSTVKSPNIARPLTLRTSSGDNATFNQIIFLYTFSIRLLLERE